ncbi:CHC2 zinc finger domain-containing protein [Terrabacter sp. MAHUQ-38]|uniref:CHC2 zinc finger domain-containing protein n=1 Tax=unclassified Terrabacter TaxID=2630222 RepID=UPI00165E8749|nr:toprim domain-containing protein [Terrabacter sp. MAHUQ-38]
MTGQRASVDVQAIRASHSLADVMAAAGIELHPRGHGWMACCPFHDDSTPSLSVEGVPDRFHCFGCGASGDVIDFVQRMRNLGFLEAVAELEGGRHAVALADGASRRARLHVVRDSPAAGIPVGRAFEINQLAWEHFATPIGTGFATQYLKHRRGIDLTPLARTFPEQPLVGHAGHGWASLTDHLRSRGVTDDELVGMDLSTRTRGDKLVDAYRNRIMVPIINRDNQIQGFVGRDISGHPAAPKYRNPTRTPVFDKAQVLYRPTHHPLAPSGQAIVVEGVIDALAIAAVAAATHLTDQVAPCSTNGVTVSHIQAREVLALSPRPPRVALDGDDAGRRGTERWLVAASLDRRAAALVTTMPTGQDPADWIAAHGPAGLRDLLLPPTDATDATDETRPHTQVPGRALIRLLLDRADDPIRDAVQTIAPIAAQLPLAERVRLLRDSAAEMTRHGWNPRDAYSQALEHALREQPARPRASNSLARTPSLI